MKRLLGVFVAIILSVCTVFVLPISTYADTGTEITFVEIVGDVPVAYIGETVGEYLGRVSLSAGALASIYQEVLESVDAGVSAMCRDTDIIEAGTYHLKVTIITENFDDYFSTPVGVTAGWEVMGWPTTINAYKYITVVPRPEIPYNVPIEEKLESLSKNEPVTFFLNEGDSLSNRMMKALLNNPNLTLEFSFEYEGVKHTVVIPAGMAVDDDTPWYGPMWLLEKYGEKGQIKAYVIQKGDTLNKLAAKWGVTVEYIMGKNPYIKDKNKIYTGKEILY